MVKKPNGVSMYILKSEITIRLASLTDIPAITEIYNEAILNGTATFDTEIKTIADRTTWLNQHIGKYPVWVAYYQNVLVAWCSLTQYSDRAAYAATAEVSVYVHYQYRGRGLGNLLVEHLVNQAKYLQLHCLLARITEGNDTSIRLHQKYGFKVVGVMREVGFKFGKFLDVTLMQWVFDKKE
ncbi:MAG: N-acetyltransferase family protein [Sphingobacteriales bacterium]|jgi:phosphinothricin acetyltransferase|nr:N-acetyltransferase family protein [Sphingobacteriales bacterium]